MTKAALLSKYTIDGFGFISRDGKFYQTDHGAHDIFAAQSLGMLEVKKKTKTYLSFSDLAQRNGFILVAREPDLDYHGGYQYDSFGLKLTNRMGIEMKTDQPFNEKDVKLLKHILPRISKDVNAFTLTYTDRKGETAWEGFSSRGEFLRWLNDMEQDMIEDKATRK